MSKDPAFLFYTSDFLTGTIFMTNEQVGIYIKLLCAQHQHGGIIDKTAFNSLVGENALLRSKFIETDRGFYNPRLNDEMEKRKQKSLILSANANVRWDKKKQKKCKSIAKALQSVSEREDVIDYRIKIEEIYLLYPLKKGKVKGIEKITKEIKTPEDMGNFEKAVKNYADECNKLGTEARYMKHFSTFCNEDWKDYINYTAPDPKPGQGGGKKEWNPFPDIPLDPSYAKEAANK